MSDDDNYSIIKNVIGIEAWNERIQLARRSIEFNVGLHHPKLNIQFIHSYFRSYFLNYTINNNKDSNNDHEYTENKNNTKSSNINSNINNSLNRSNCSDNSLPLFDQIHNINQIVIIVVMVTMIVKLILIITTRIKWIIRILYYLI